MKKIFMMLFVLMMLTGCSGFRFGLGLAANSKADSLRYQDASGSIEPVGNPIGVVRGEFDIAKSEKGHGRLEAYIEHESSLWDSSDGYGKNTVGIILYTK